MVKNNVNEMSICPEQQGETSLQPDEMSDRLRYRLSGDPGHVGLWSGKLCLRHPFDQSGDLGDRIQGHGRRQSARVAEHRHITCAGPAQSETRCDNMGHRFGFDLDADMVQAGPRRPPSVLIASKVPKQHMRKFMAQHPKPRLGSSRPSCTSMRIFQDPVPRCLVAKPPWVEERPLNST